MKHIKLHRYLFLLSFVMLLSSCIRDVEELSYPDNSKTKLVLYCIISPLDSIIQVKVKRTRPFFYDSGTYNENVRDATVFLSDGSSTVQLRFVPFYFNNIEFPERATYQITANEFKIISGKTYYLTVNTPEGLTARAQCEIPLAGILKKLNRLDRITDPEGRIKFPMEMKWEVGDKKIKYYQYLGDMEIKRIDDYNYDTIITNSLQGLNMDIYPEQLGNTMEGIFYDQISTNYNKFSTYKTKNIYFTIYDDNFYNMQSDYAKYNNQRHHDINWEYKTVHVNGDTISLNSIVIPDSYRAHGYLHIKAGKIELRENLHYQIDWRRGKIKFYDLTLPELANGIDITYGNYSYYTDPSNYVSEDSLSIPFEEFLFTEPAIYFTNVEGGLGIFCAFNQTKVNLE
jgi:hypothetical protein